MDFSTLQPLLDTLIKALVALLAGLLGLAVKYAVQYVEAWLKAKVGPEQLVWMAGVIEGLVKAAAQNPAFADLNPEALKSLVLQEAVAFCEQYKLPFDENFLDTLIEAAVAEWKEYAGYSASTRHLKG